MKKRGIGASSCEVGNEVTGIRGKKALNTFRLTSGNVSRMLHLFLEKNEEVMAVV